jgi:hypothetical protein
MSMRSKLALWLAWRRSFNRILDGGRVRVWAAAQLATGPPETEVTSAVGQRTNRLERGGCKRPRQSVHRKPRYCGKGVWLKNFWHSRHDHCRVHVSNPALPGAVVEMIYRTYSPTKFDCNSEFFANFTYHGIFHAFAGFDFSTWQPPMVRFRASSSFDKKYLRSFDDRCSAAQARFGFYDRSDLVRHCSSVGRITIRRHESLRWRVTPKPVIGPRVARTRWAPTRAAGYLR